MREFKSLFVALCMAYVSVDTASYHACTTNHLQCSASSRSIQLRALGLAVLYIFIRETVDDTRDVEEDTAEKLNTLPVRLGKTGTLWLVAVVGHLGDTLLTQAAGFNGAAFFWDPVMMFWSLTRVGLTMTMCLLVLKYRRESVWQWAAFSLLGISPILWAQIDLVRIRTA